jgi:type VI secretion system protein ImpJ
MEFFRPIHWHEGMLLRPEHFQWQDRRTEAATSYLFSVLNPFPWGVVDYTVDRDALQAGRFELEALTVVFPDGALARHPGNAAVETRPIEEFMPQTGRALPVYVGLRPFKPSENNVMSPHDPDRPKQARFSVREAAEETYDLFASQKTAPVDFLYYDLRIFFGSEKDNAADWSLIKIAEVIRTEKGAGLNPNYIPPAAALSADPGLLKLVIKARDLLTAKARDLRELKASLGLRTQEIGGRDLLTLLYAVSVNRHAPLLHQITAEGLRCHPWHVYGLLRSAAGELSAYSDQFDFLGAGDGQSELPEYDHLDLYGCFSRAVDLIDRLLDALTYRAGYSVKLTWDGEYYSADVDPRTFEGDNRYYLIVTTQMPAKDLLAVMKDTAKICSREAMPTLITRALFGVPAEHLPTAPPKLPQKAHAHYFALDPGSTVWKKIVEDRDIAVSFEKKQLEDIDIEFTVVGEES